VIFAEKPVAALTIWRDKSVSAAAFQARTY